ncbi:hypothetical protein ANRL1_01326 [Anaerolineae bacterium]|nr:hypothetical protein ANRL1_01326 [Anaerolineae bacterium]
MKQFLYQLNLIDCDACGWWHHPGNIHQVKYESRSMWYLCDACWNHKNCSQCAKRIRFWQKFIRVGLNVIHIKCVLEVRNCK